jgi:hypothetical protein
MQNTQKLPLKELFKLMAPVHARVSKQVYKDYQGIIESIPGSHAKHQAWAGGYISHIEETMNIAIGLYDMLDARRKLNVSLSGLLFCAYLHDFDKLFRYTMQPDGTWKGKPANKMLYLDKLVSTLEASYNYTLTDDEYKAIKYTHGEPEDEYNPTTRIIQPLGTIVHCADIISARVWHDFGKTSDNWID